MRSSRPVTIEPSEHASILAAACLELQVDPGQPVVVCDLGVDLDLADFKQAHGARRAIHRDLGRDDQKATKN